MPKRPRQWTQAEKSWVVLDEEDWTSPAGSGVEDEQPKDDASSSPATTTTSAKHTTILDLVSSSKTARNWCITLEPKDNSRLTVMEVLAGPLWFLLVGSLETVDEDNSNPHYHCLFHRSTPCRKGVVANEIKQVCPQMDLTYIAPVRVQNAYVKYMYKTQPELLDDALTLMNNKWGANTKSAVAESQPTEERTLSTLEIYLQGLKKEFVERPPLDDMLRRCMKDMGLEQTSNKEKSIRLFHSLWMNQTGEDEPMKKKMMLAADLFKPDDLTIDAGMMGNSLWKVLINADYTMPVDMTPIVKPARAFYTLCTMYLIAALPRVPGNFKQLWLCGKPGVGKSILTSWLIGKDKRRKDIAGDACGVGRYSVNPDQEVIVFEEATEKQINKEENLRTLNSLADGRNTTVKVHSTVTSIKPMWLIVNSNIRLSDMTMSDQSKFANCAYAHSMQRRFIQVAINTNLQDVPMFDAELGKSKNLDIISALIGQIYSTFRNKMDKDLLEFAENVMKLFD